MQADPAGRTVGGGPGIAAAGSAPRSAGRFQQVGQIVDGSGQPAPAPTCGGVPATGGGQFGGLRPGGPQGSFRVGQQPFGLGGGGLGQIGQLSVLAAHHRQRLVPGGGVAGPQFRVQVMGPPAGGPGSVPQFGADRTTGGLDPATGRGDPADRFREQPGIGRIGHVRRHHGGVDPDPGAAQQLRLRRLRQQSLVQPLDRGRTAPGGQLHQRRRVRHRLIDADPAELPPGDRVRHLPAQRLEPQPVAELEEHHPQIGFHRRRRPTDPRVEERRERGEEPRIVQQSVHPGQLDRQPPQFIRQDRFPQRRLITYGTKHEWSQSLLAQGFGTILPCQRHFQRSTRLDYFRSK